MGKREVISIEEYLFKRKAIKEQERSGWNEKPAATKGRQGGHTI